MRTKKTENILAYSTSVLALSFVIFAYALTNASSPSAEMSSLQISGKNSLQVLFLGDDGHHRPAERIQEVIPYFAKRGINIHYTDRQEDLTLSRLEEFDVFMQFGNRSHLTSEQEKALLSYVHNGGGFVALHSASASFLNSDAFINLVGGAFNWHGVGVLKTDLTEPNHPVLDGLSSIESWDESYVHVAHNPDKTVLSVREEDGHKEPWTWVRNHGDGRVFYTAWGHDSRTWTNAGFQQLLERGLRWSAGDWALDAEFAPAELTYGEGELPYYPAGEDWGTTGNPIKQIQNPLNLKESMEHLVIDPSFSIELFAADPEISNPIDMAWDEQGRLWITETVDYPNKFADDRIGNDRIKILEDTNGDGKADNITIFAEGLNIPTSLVLSNGGAIVAQAPDILFFKDTTGDGKADHKEVLMTGWQTFDTHAGPNNLQYGFDNQIWGAVGYAGFEGSVGNEEFNFAQGFFRFKPDVSEMEFVSNTTNNTWGLGFNEEGVAFGSTANGNPAVHSAVSNKFYESVSGWNSPRLPMIANNDNIYALPDSIRQVDHHGRFTSGSGFHVYTARDFPKEYWNRMAFVSEPTGHLMSKFILESDGSGYKADNSWNLIASLDEWFSPIQAKVGPDGALWFVDWYNLVIQHNPQPDGWDLGEGNAYVSDLRDRDHARIYRVVYNEAEHKEAFNLKNASAGELVSALNHDNLFWRLTAQRLLVERGDTDVLPALYQLTKENRVDELGLTPGALHALWTIHGLGALDGSNTDALQVALNSLHHPSSSVRRSALMVLPRNQDISNKILNAGFLPNPDVPGGVGYRRMSGDPQVRLAALLALAEMPSSESAGRSIAELLLNEADANDRWIRDAATAAGSRHDRSFLAHILDKEINQNADSTYKANVASAIERITRHHADKGASGALAGQLASLRNTDHTIGLAFVGGLAAGSNEVLASKFNSQQKNALRELRASLPVEYSEKLDALADKWNTPDLFGTR
ncbi:MAG: PVC-type heme-binding CxxCH protein [Balneolales bacterium]